MLVPLLELTVWLSTPINFNQKSLQLWTILILYILSAWLVKAITNWIIRFGESKHALLVIVRIVKSNRSARKCGSSEV